jgi:hypothetical protein
MFDVICLFFLWILILTGKQSLNHHENIFGAVCSPAKQPWFSLNQQLRLRLKTATATETATDSDRD